jgi:hypothetical protein
MTPTKEMIEAVEYMAETGECEKIESIEKCFLCPGNSQYNNNKLCGENGWSDIKLGCDEFDKTLQASAKNWIKENGIKLYLDPENPGKLTRVPNDFGSVGEITKENKLD